ncbi:MAG: response regulator transcription factor [Actinomycetota bacterium]|nr:response regulator transcription factor [Actinomycetota bacterium]
MTTPLTARLLLADDHPIVRHGLCLLLERQPDFDVVAQAADGADAVTQALAIEIDLAILDVSMPKLTGLQATRQITEHRPGVRVLILSMHDNEEFFFEALRAGASGYVLKSAAEQDLVNACRAAMRGEPFIYSGAIGALIRAYLEHQDERADPLSPRETEIVKLIAEGHTSREIGEVLGIAEKTVERHRSNVLEKLGLRDRVGLTRYAVRRGLVEP